MSRILYFPLSLSYLHGLPLDSLKIDKSFIDSLRTDSATSSVTLYIISIAKTLRLKTIAEGIGTHAQVDYLIEHGVEYGQGWFFAKAMPAKDFIRFYECRLQPDEGRLKGRVEGAKYGRDCLGPSMALALRATKTAFLPFCRTLCSGFSSLF